MILFNKAKKREQREWGFLLLLFLSEFLVGWIEILCTHTGQTLKVDFTYLSMEKMRRKTLFWILFPMVLLTYAIPLAVAIVWQETSILGLVLAGLFSSAGFFFSTYFLYRLTYKQKPKYPMVPPDGKPDVYYRYGIPRPIYEDMEQHPWFFKKRKKRPTERAKKVEKKH